jgi:hypothetical protein
VARLALRLLRLSLALGVAAAALGAQAPPPVLVRRCYDELERALARRDGEAALARLSAASPGEWQRLRHLALRGSIPEVEALPPGRRLAVLALRHSAPPFLRRDGSPRELVLRAVESGLLDGSAADLAEVGDVAVREERASALLLVSGLPSGVRAGFVREADAWKLDLAASLDAAGRLVAQTSEATGTSEDGVIVNLIAAASGRRVGAEVWQPLEGRDGGAPPPSHPGEGSPE